MKVCCGAALILAVSIEKEKRGLTTRTGRGETTGAKRKGKRKENERRRGDYGIDSIKKEAAREREGKEGRRERRERRERGREREGARERTFF